MHYCVVGVNGSGKTSLLNVISAKTGIETIHGTSELMSYLGISGDYNALRAMDQNQVLIKWGETAEYLLNKYAEKPFLLDTHLLNLTKGRVIPRDGPWIRKYDGMVLIKAAPATILSRVIKDSTKDRALFPDGLSETEKLHMLTSYQQQTEELFNEICKRYKLRSLIINNDDTLEEGAASFMRFQNSLGGLL